jgi:hypothetical protein
VTTVGVIGLGLLGHAVVITALAELPGAVEGKP